MKTKQEHSKYSASGAHRWMECTASIKMIEKAPPSKSSDFAIEGTVAHELAYRCLKENVSPKKFKGHVLNNVSLFPVNDEMICHVEGYISLIKDLTNKDNFVSVEYEKKVFLMGFDNELFGTCDCIIYYKNKITVIDFKYGAGKSISAKNNKQLLYYLYGAIYSKAAAKFRTTPPDDVLLETVIYQPRDPLGVCIDVACPTINDIYELSRNLMQAYDEAKGETPRFKVGDHCGFCDAAAICPKLAQDALAVAKVDFSDSLEDYKPPDIEALTSPQISFILKLSKPLSSFLKKVEAYAHNLLSEGHEVEGFILSEGRRTRSWHDTKDVIEKLSPILGDKIYETKLKTPAQIEKLSASKEDKEFLSSLIKVNTTLKIKELKKMKKLLTPEFRVSFPSVFTRAKAFDSEKEGKYELTMLFDKNKADLVPIMEAIDDAIKQKWGDKLPPKLYLPFKDGDTEDETRTEYKGTMYAKASSKIKPQLVNAAVEAIIDQEEFYAGCYARATINIFTFSKVNNGVGIGLMNIQKVRDGEHFGIANADPKNDFSKIETSNASENSSNYTK